MPSRDSHASILAARHRFFGDGLAPRGMIPDAILASWQRCLGHGLSVNQRPRLAPVEAAALTALKERHEALQRLCRPELELLYASARANGSIVVLTAADGYILDALGSADFLDKAARVALRPGVSWDETAIGTNAIGTAMVERRPIEVRGGEHYFAPHRVLSCSASPILDPQGGLAGVLDLSGEASVHHVHALGMVQLAVTQIEHRLFEQRYAQADILRLHRDAALLGTAGEGLLVFEEQRLVAANRHALQLLGLDWSQLGQRRYDELFSGLLPAPGQPGLLRCHQGEHWHVRRGEPRRIVLPPSQRRRSSDVPTPAPAAASPGDSLRIDTSLEPLLRRGVRLLDADIPLLLQGETGTGKELMARELHRRSRRSHASFVAINCAALPEGLIESELFGYAPGAFTGARREGMPGLLREAHGGVLFLDEIGDMPLALQSRLLRVLQEREVLPLGARQVQRLDVAVIAATHRPLEHAVEQGAFRADLYYRIAQASLPLPPLREREDRAGLIDTLWRALGAEAAELKLAPATMQRLLAYHWPGNLRQLVSQLRTLIALADPGSVIGPEQLPAALRTEPPATRPPGLCTSLAGTAASGEPAAGLQQQTLAAMEAALLACHGNVSAAARRLGISRSTLYRHLRH